MWLLSTRIQTIGYSLSATTWKEFKQVTGCICLEAHNSALSGKNIYRDHTLSENVDASEYLPKILQLPGIL